VGETDTALLPSNRVRVKTKRNHNTGKQKQHVKSKWNRKLEIT
jgi:hypothetical protein